MAAKDTQNTIARPDLTFPDEVSDWVRSHYESAGVILEYGSGGSTVMGSELSGKHLFSVESDRRWYRMMLRYLRQAGTTSPVKLSYANIGPVGKWGRPKDDEGWRGYHRYPNLVWDSEGFLAPDLVLIDGRFRAACLMTVMLRTEKPVTVLFDDYVGRKQYERVERWLKPVEIRGRMAKFDVSPTELPRKDLTEILTLYTKPF
ncbi:hypothetical protein [Shimia sp. SDUM112013]|uniref:hypothetical protein n=1 Tax=Shimia sp. SDUM112013 TaxID=3136160 RepID=UPI0032EFF2F3